MSREVAVMGRRVRLPPLRSLASFCCLAALLLAAGRLAAEDYPVGNRGSMWQDPYMIGSFRHWDDIFPVRVVPRAGPVSELPRAAEPIHLEGYAVDGATLSLEDYFARARTTGLIVLKDGKVVYERYRLGADEHSRFASMSTAKSVVSTLVGFAVADGLIDSVDRPITDYLPELKGTGYDGVPIKAVLQMSSGVDFTEDYDDPSSDFMRLWYDVVDYQKERLDDAVAKARPGVAPFALFNYKSIDTAALGWLVARVTGKTLADYLAEKLWGPLGMEADAEWGVEDRRPGASEVAFCCLNATLRDYARFGLFMAQQGNWQGRQLLPAAWIAEATHPDRPQVAPGRLYEDYALGYQYQWWCFPGPDGAFTAQGVNGQFLYVNSARRLVIAMTSAWPDFWDDGLETETYALFDALAAAAGP
jgi:CubicO group peptidase (beta-lactamase class C family)